MGFFIFKLTLLKRFSIFIKKIKEMKKMTIALALCSIVAFSSCQNNPNESVSNTDTVVTDTTNVIKDTTMSISDTTKKIIDTAKKTK